MFRRVYLFCAVALVLSPVAVVAQADDLNPTPHETQAFLAADRNRDALLEFSEFKTFVRLMAKTGQPTARQIRFFSAYRYAFGVADRNDDQVVSPAELRQADDAHQAGEGQMHN